jgi:hypothetical protein
MFKVIFQLDALSIAFQASVQVPFESSDTLLQALGRRSSAYLVQGCYHLRSATSWTAEVTSRSPRLPLRPGSFKGWDLPGTDAL